MRFLKLLRQIMGAHLSSPRTEKVSSSGGDLNLDSTIFGSSSMQGWRISMEDAHMTLPRFVFNSTLDRKLGERGKLEVDRRMEVGPEKLERGPSFDKAGANKLKGSLYGVFDGHGGNCVSRWASENFSFIFSNELDLLLSDKRGGLEGSESPENISEESYLVGKALENSFLRLDEYLLKPEVDKQLHMISINKKNTGAESANNLFKVLLPEKINNRQHALDIIQQLTNTYNISYNVNQLDPQKPVEEVKLNKYDSIPYCPVEGAEGMEEDDINAELGLVSGGNKLLGDVPSEQLGAEELKDDLRGTGLEILGPAENEDELDKELEEFDPDLTDLTRPEQGEREHRLDPNDQRLDHAELCAMGCGSTSVVAMVLEDPVPCVIVANAGDSRCVLSRNKVAIPLSTDHKPTDEPEMNRIKNAGGYVINGRVDGNLNLSRSLGDLSFKLDTTLSNKQQKIISFPDIKVIKLTKDDEFLVLACDGIWDCRTNQQIVDYVHYKYQLYSSGHGGNASGQGVGSSGNGTSKLQAGAPSGSGLTRARETAAGDGPGPVRGDDDKRILEKICEELCDVCLSNNPSESEGIGCDNMTIIIVKFSQSLYRKMD